MLLSPGSLPIYKELSFHHACTIEEYSWDFNGEELPVKAWTPEEVMSFCNGGPQPDQGGDPMATDEGAAAAARAMQVGNVHDAGLGSTQGVPVIPVGQAPAPTATPAAPMDMGLIFTQMMQMSQATQQANQELLRRMEGLGRQNAPHATDEERAFA
uniref:Uncharacterized protein n=1 Tax=Dunaliella tertiolecta TaxID=3047 RepID=A0A6S8IKX7_DUNTE|mmetsp:Transcript_17118/g.47474  ORF Transcript_17118/g.47474 Transcript_17118/m.47474 type:complete len:156 (-) Transcript_17118:766-1233(-)